jgi:hypothetical protein
VFRLLQEDAFVRGTIFDVDVSGTQTPDATSVALNGSTTQFGLRSGVQATIVPTKDLSSFTGTLNATLREGPSAPCGTRIYGQIIDAHRVPFDTSTSSFAGVWTGSFGVDDCSFVRWTYCYPIQKGHTASLYLELNQVGSSMSGKLRLNHGTSALPTPYDMTVKGIVSDGRLALEGSLTTSSSGGQSVLRLTDWSTTRDDLGRMAGSFSYIDEYDSAGTIASTTSHNVLVGVTLNPARWP